MGKVLGIVGSPRRGGLTGSLVNEALRGVESAGVETEVIYLIDRNIEPCLDCRGKTCWTTGSCRFGDDSVALNRELDLCSGVVLAAPVYYLNVNGLTQKFMEKTRVRDVNGKPAFGIAVAGGTGKGLISALQSIYRFLTIVGFRGIDPLPVSRFNAQRALERAYLTGRRLGELARGPRSPFKDLAERIAWYASLEYMGFDIVDENLFLARLVLENAAPSSEADEALLREARLECSRAERLVGEGRRAEAVEHIIAAYDRGVQVWRRLERGHR